MTDKNIHTSHSVRTHKYLQSRLKKWRKGVAAVRAGTGNMRLLIVGDSTTIGVNGSGVAQVPNEYQSLAVAITRAGVPAQENSFFGFSAGSGARTLADTRITRTGWYLDTGHNTLGGNMSVADFTGHTITFTPTNQCDTFRVFYNVYGSSAQITVQATGGASKTIYSNASTNGTQFNGTIYYADVSAASLGNNAVTLTYAAGSGAFYLLGIEAWDSTKKQCIVTNAGWWGGLVGDFVVSSNSYNSGNLLNGYPSGYYDAVIIKAGINDCVYNVTKDSFKSRVQTLITSVSGRGSDVILETDNPYSGGANFGTYADALQELADENTLVFIDQNARLESYTVANGLGFMSDTMHPSVAGYVDMAGAVSEALLRAVGR